MPVKYKAIIVFLSVLLGIALISIIVIAATGSSKEDQVQNLEKDGSVETSVSVQHADSTHDVILTSHKVWLKGNEYTTVLHKDTIPALDSTTAEAENDNGDSKIVTVKKDYQLFITVK